MPGRLPEQARSAFKRALSYLEQNQTPRGCWLGEVKWNILLLSQYVIVSHITGQRISPAKCEKILRYFQARQTADGGWGMHEESPAYVFMTALGYVALRLLGLEASEEMPRRALQWLRQQGGVLAIPSWGKFWLALLGLYRWEGVNPILPELWLLPRWLPFHPRRYYNHTRLIYLGMAYLYGRKFTAQSPMTGELRNELYGQPFEEIDFSAWRHRVAPNDLYVPVPPVFKLSAAALRAYERAHSKGWRRRALDECFERIVFEVRSTNHASISPVNGLLNVLALFDQNHPDLSAAYEGLDYWRWEDDAEGIRYVGAHSHTWDTSFTVQAVLSGPEELSERTAASLRKAYGFLKNTQIQKEIPEGERWFRDRLLGGWCFSDDHHQWPVSDCTAEALSAVLLLDRENFRDLNANRGHEPTPSPLPGGEPATGAANEAPLLGGAGGGHRCHELMAIPLNRPPGTFSPTGGEGRDEGAGFTESLIPMAERIPNERLIEAAEFILSRQNEDGGFGSFERRRGSVWLENLNPTEMFGNCMVEGSYVECTASCVAGLARFRERFPGIQQPAIDGAIQRGVELILGKQLDDGSWPGLWGVNYTYGIFFCVEGLLAAGLPPAHPAMQRAGQWLLSKQKPEGGWGEHWKSCLENHYREHPQSQIIMTSWALLALQAAGIPAREAIERGTGWLVSRQLADGSFPEESVAGVFFKTGLLHYTLYKNYFPLWALGRFLRANGNSEASPKIVHTAGQASEFVGAATRASKL